MAVSSVLNAKPQAAEDTAAFGPIAERFRRAGDLERAISLCREGLQKFPQHISARVTLGWALLDLSKYDEARIELEQALRRAPDNLAAIRGLAELHDRSEHTLHLPMDGPGQWPPDALAVERAAASTSETAFGFPPAVDLSDEPVLLTAGDVPDFEPDFLQAGPAVITSAELGAALWSSAPPAEPWTPAAESILTSTPEAETPLPAAFAAMLADEVAASLVAEAAATLADGVAAPLVAESAVALADEVAAPLVAEAAATLADEVAEPPVAESAVALADESAAPPVAESAVALGDEVAEPLVTESAVALADEVAEPLVAESAATLVDEVAAPLVAESAVALADEVAAPLVAESAVALADEVAASLVAEAAATLADEVAEPLVAESAVALADESAAPLVAESAVALADEVAAPLVAESAVALADESAAPLVAESAVALADEVAAPLVAASVEALVAESAVTLADEVAAPLLAESAGALAEDVEALTATAPTTDLDPVAELEAAQTAVVSEADIAALIAEADSLEAAAESGAAEPALVLDAAMDLVGFDDVALVLPDALPEPSAAQSAESAFHAEEPEGMEDATLAVQGVAHAHIAEVVSLARVAESKAVRSPVASLERFLARTRARRRQLMTESVA